MTRLTLIGAALVAGALGLPVAAQQSPDTEVAPAAVGDGTSTQHVEVLAGTVEATTTAGGTLDLGTDSGTLTASGAAGVEVNGIGIEIGGGLDDVQLVGLPDEAGGGPGGPGDVGTTPGDGTGATPDTTDLNGDGRIDDADRVAARVAALGDPTSCVATDTSRLNEGAPEVIAAISGGDRLDLVLLCAGDNALSPSQREAIAGNRTIVGTLDRVGLSTAQVVGIRFAEGHGTLYVRATE
jgi:hypothetical protein